MKLYKCKGLLCFLQRNGVPGFLQQLVLKFCSLVQELSNPGTVVLDRSSLLDRHQLETDRMSTEHRFYSSRGAVNSCARIIIILIRLRSET